MNGEVLLKKILWVLMLVLAVTAASAAAAVYGLDGPAPNAGDGVSDGSGFTVDPGANSGVDAFGPAPNSGDGTSDGSGLSAPHG